MKRDHFLSFLFITAQLKCADLVDLMIFYLEDISNTETEKQPPRGLLNEQIQKI